MMWDERGAEQSREERREGTRSRGHFRKIYNFYRLATVPPSFSTGPPFDAKGVGQVAASLPIALLLLPTAAVERKAEWPLIVGDCNNPPRLLEPLLDLSMVLALIPGTGTGTTLPLRLRVAQTGKGAPPGRHDTRLTSTAEACRR